MVFITSMLCSVMVLKWTESGMVIAFVISFVMELINIFILTTEVKKIENRIDERYKETIANLRKDLEEDIKRAEIYKQEAARWKTLFDKTALGDSNQDINESDESDESENPDDKTDDKKKPSNAK